ncbi:MAG: hypothetical protein NTW21_21520 [Verrucomicrobia bacterium]|nr:hypothetical protein [Verrucomicrobiota bacterium]
MNRWYLLVLLLGFGACAGQNDLLEVKLFKLKDQKDEVIGDPMIRCEKQRRLHGAVSVAERNARLGAYYTILWNDPRGLGSGEVEVLFEYQQGATASEVKRMAKRFGSTESSGKVEFAIIGDDFLKHGRVLAWRATLSRGGRNLATKTSLLWQ